MRPEQYSSDQLLYLAKQDFNKAREITCTGENLDSKLNSLIIIAEKMTSVDLPPTQILDYSLKLKDDRENYQDFINTSVACVYGMLGDFEKFPSLLLPADKDPHLFAVKPYLYSGNALIRRGEDPTRILEQAMDRVAKNQSFYANYLDKTEKYVQIARVFHQANLDPKITFIRAEETLTRTRRRYQKENLFDYRSYHELAVGYASCNLHEDAFRIVELLDKYKREQYGPKYMNKTGQTLQNIANEYILQGNFDMALVAARKLDFNRLTAKILSLKAINEAELGENVSEIISESLSLIKGTNSPEVYEEVYPFVALAMYLSGRSEEANQSFTMIRQAINEMDILDKAFTGTMLAETLDKTGRNAMELYEQVFKWADQFRNEEPDWEKLWGVSWWMYENSINSLIRRGYFDLAREYINKYPDEPWNKPRLFADLAQEEAKIALKLK